MDPFFGDFSWYNQQTPFRPSFPQYPKTNVASNPIKRSEIPKSVKVPVQFLKQRPVNRSVSATKIQKVYRGFLVRKSMKRILDVKKQVDLIDETLSKCEIVDLVRKDEKERLRMHECLMGLLFKLDSVRGFDLGVRDCRKRVIRKAIALQERIDAIAVVDLTEDDEKVEKEEDLNEIGLIVDVDVEIDSEVKNVESVEFLEEGSIEKDEKGDIGDWVDVEESKDDNKRNNDMMERLMEDSAKMMNMMTALFESNAKQMEMLSALSNRVEMLEKAIDEVD